MKFDDIIPILANDEVVMIAGGEVIIKKKLNSVIGGVPVFSLYVDFPKENKEPITFNTLDKLEDYSILNADAGIKRCLVCDGLPKAGYYYDNEMKQSYCCYSCLVKWMNSVHGVGNWKVATGVFDKLTFYIEMKDEEVKEVLKSDVPPYNYMIEEGRYFREYDCIYVPPYDGVKTVVGDNGCKEYEDDLDTLFDEIFAQQVQMHDKEEKLVDNEETQLED